jgi:hypothetical protein
LLNNPVIAADTSSPAATTIPVVEGAAVAVAAVIASPIPLKSADAAANAAGAAITYDAIGAPINLGLHPAQNHQQRGTVCTPERMWPKSDNSPAPIFGATGVL